MTCLASALVVGSGSGSVIFVIIIIIFKYCKCTLSSFGYIKYGIYLHSNCLFWLISEYSHWCLGRWYLYCTLIHQVLTYEFKVHKSTAHIHISPSLHRWENRGWGRLSDQSEISQTVRGRTRPHALVSMVPITCRFHNSTNSN